MDNKMREDLEKAQAELAEQSKQYEEEKKKNMEELVEKRANLIGGFISSQQENEFREITKVVYQFLGNDVEDYIAVSIHNEDRVFAVASNLMGIEHLDGFPQHLAERFFQFAFNNYDELIDVEKNTQFEINFENS